MDHTNKALGLRVQTQIPLDVKEYSTSENTLKNLGIDNNLAFTYIKGLQIICLEESTRWEWLEVEIGKENTGLLDVDFTYPNDIITFGVDYSNKAYNFFKVFNTFAPLEKIDEGNGEGIIIRDRDSFNYISIGLQAIDLGRIEPNNLGFPNVAGAGANYSGVLSGTNGTVDSTGVNSVIGGGRGNYISPRRSGIFSGSGNQITNTTFGANENNSILGGALNYISGEYCVIGGGYQNTIDGSLVNTSTNVLSGGFGNLIKSSRNSSITGGEVNTILNSVSSTIIGGSANNISNHNFGTILGGLGNRTYTAFETVVGIKNTEYTPNNTEQDRLFTIGNGGGIKDNSNPAGNLFVKSDAVIILKNGLATLPSVTNVLITAASGKAIVTKEYLESTLPDGSETKIANGITTTKSGLGNIASPYTIEVNNLQKEITGNYTIVNPDNNYTIFINNGATPITITLNTSVTTSNFCVGFIQEGTADVTFVGTGVNLTNPIGMKSKGQGYQTFIERKLATSSFYLLGNTKL
jgi:hypothetical protein